MSDKVAASICELADELGIRAYAVWENGERRWFVTMSAEPRQLRERTGYLDEYTFVILYQQKVWRQFKVGLGRDRIRTSKPFLTLFPGAVPESRDH